MALKDLMATVYDCYLIITLRNSKGIEATAFDDSSADDETDLKRVVQEFGECPVVYVSAADTNFLHIIVSAEYEKVPHYIY